MFFARKVQIGLRCSRRGKGSTSGARGTKRHVAKGKAYVSHRLALHVPRVIFMRAEELRFMSRAVTRYSGFSPIPAIRLCFITLMRESIRVLTDGGASAIILLYFIYHIKKDLT